MLNTPSRWIVPFVFEGTILNPPLLDPLHWDKTTCWQFSFSCQNQNKNYNNNNNNNNNFNPHACSNKYINVIPKTNPHDNSWLYVHFGIFFIFFIFFAKFLSSLHFKTTFVSLKTKTIFFSMFGDWGDSDQSGSVTKLLTKQS